MCASRNVAPGIRREGTDPTALTELWMRCAVTQNDMACCAIIGCGLKKGPPCIVPGVWTSGVTSVFHPRKIQQQRVNGIDC